MRRSALDIGSSACGAPLALRALGRLQRQRAQAPLAPHAVARGVDDDLPFAVAAGQRRGGGEVLHGVDRLPVAADQARRVAAAGDRDDARPVLGHA